MIHFNIGRLTIGLFPYSIGFSWRYLKSMGRILDFGYLKLVWWPKPSSAAKDCSQTQSTKE